jgi:hypothetical protein
MPGLGKGSWGRRGRREATARRGGGRRRASAGPSQARTRPHATSTAAHPRPHACDPPSARDPLQAPTDQCGNSLPPSLPPSLFRCRERVRIIKLACSGTVRHAAPCALPCSLQVGAHSKSLPGSPSPPSSYLPFGSCRVNTERLCAHHVSVDARSLGACPWCKSASVEYAHRSLTDCRSRSAMLLS